MITSEIEIQKAENNGYEPGLGGLASLSTAIFAVGPLGLYVIMSFALKTKPNWILQ